MHIPDSTLWMDAVEVLLPVEFVSLPMDDPEVVATVPVFLCTSGPKAAQAATWNKKIWSLKYVRLLHKMR